MGSHRSPDELGSDSGAPGHSGRGSTDRQDHFGLFDDDEHEGRDDEAGTGELSLDALREVLAGDPEDLPEHADEHHHAARPAVGHAPPGRQTNRPRRRRRHPVISTIIVILVIGLILGGLGFGFMKWRQSAAAPEDWAGTGARTVVVRVQPGDGLFAVGQTLVDAGVVASVTAFAQVAADDGRLAGLQPGYYRVHEHSSSQVVVDDLADPANRLGQLRIVPGDTLADVTKVATTGSTETKLGILSKIAKACFPTNGASQCFSVDDLWKEATTANLADLQVVGWATGDVEKAPDPKKRLEGLILPGDYDIAPGSTAFEALRSVVSASAAQWNTTGIVAAAKSQDMTPYQLATVASLVQAEASDDNPADQAKVARVIYNRLHDGIKLEFDSTVNYGLDRASISTTRAERLDPANLYSTYAHAGLTPTPIGAPGPKGLDAAEEPATGPWLFFVAIDLDGNSCFSTTNAEHEKCVDQARANGVFG